ncbi:MAG: response regulator [Armatimonadetes bacterium]|nr:response regulator [Armatimonadota bacterium]
MHILLADDEEGVRKALARRLERTNLQVTLAANAEEAIKFIREADQPYAAIVTDMSMEKPQSGLDVLDAALQRDMFAQVIVLTAYGTVANAVEAMRRGAFDYLEKNAPDLDPYELIVIKVNQALARRGRDMKFLQTYMSLNRA